MLHLLIGTDWTANRDEILRRISRDVKEEKNGRILMVPELISHETERRLCAAAGDTASRFAEVLSFTRMGRRVADEQGSAAEACLDAGGRVVAMAAAARQLSSRLKAYASVETKPEFLTGLIEAVDEFKRCCISSVDLKAAAGETEGSLAQKLEELALILESYDALCAHGKCDPRDQETLLLEQLMQGDFAKNHVFYIDGFPDFTRQHMAILEHLIQNSPSVIISMNCDKVDSKLLAFEKAGDTASQLLRIAKAAGQEVLIERIPARHTELSPMRNTLFQGQILPGSSGDTVKVYQTESPYQECLAAAEQIMELVRGGCRYRDITVVCADLTAYQSLPIDGVILVTSPQDLVAMIVGKAVKMAQMMNIPMLGFVENYSYFQCPDCGKQYQIFGESKLNEVAMEHCVPVLARLPINPETARLFDAGQMDQIDLAPVDAAATLLSRL